MNRRVTRDLPRLNAEFFKALGHPLRMRLLELLNDGARSVTELLDHVDVDVDVEQPYLSQQLGVLRRAGLVVARREGSHVIYTLSDERITELLALSRRIQLDMITAIHDELHAS